MLQLIAFSHDKANANVQFVDSRKFIIMFKIAEQLLISTASPADGRYRLAWRALKV